MRAKFIACFGLLAVVLALAPAPALAQPTGEGISSSGAAGVALTTIGGGGGRVAAALGGCLWSACAPAAAAAPAGAAILGADATAIAGLSAGSSLAAVHAGQIPAGGAGGAVFTSALGALAFGGAGSNGPAVVVVTAGSGTAASGDGAHRLFSPSPEDGFLRRRRRDDGFPPDPGPAPGSIVPEPCSLALFALGCIGLAVPLRRFLLA